MEKDLEELEKIIEFQFRNKELLKTALTHRSYKISHKELDLEDNERLEFLGDAVLNLCISQWIFHKYQKDQEGVLTKKRAYLVCKATLIKVAKKLNLLDYLYLGKREQHLDLKSKENIAARALEALIGAIFLESGLEVACEKVKTWFKPYLLRLPKTIGYDYKTELQEFLQSKYHERPEYEVVSVSGPPHNPKFEVVVKINGQILGKGKGPSKKEAENLAAKKALKQLKTEEKEEYIKGGA